MVGHGGINTNEDGWLLLIKDGRSRESLHCDQTQCEYPYNHRSYVDYPTLKDGACDYAKSRVASGGLTEPP